jgi:hypothetical protein
VFTTLDRPIFYPGNRLFGADAPPVPNFAPGSSATGAAPVPPPTPTIAVATAAELGLDTNKE